MGMGGSGRFGRHRLKRWGLFVAPAPGSLRGFGCLAHRFPSPPPSPNPGGRGAVTSRRKRKTRSPTEVAHLHSDAPSAGFCSWPSSFLTSPLPRTSVLRWEPASGRVSTLSATGATGKHPKLASQQISGSRGVTLGAWPRRQRPDRRPTAGRRTPVRCCQRTAAAPPASPRTLSHPGALLCHRIRP